MPSGHPRNYTTLTDVTPWGVIRIAAGLPDVRPHDLRHSFAAAMAAGGMSLLMIGGLLGHRNSATTQRYAHLAHDPLKEKTDQIASTLAAHLNADHGAAEILPLPRR
ncbi:tyrosine-type recombinase/integrase [Paracoccus zhejiangensis]|uniref:Tyr recombinase domain-containing protein n=1 Tax=Paracoccus zhejiangensis TaxID=1077935 RepID=A0A2H5F3B4_9RHOB|nr:tyrosine-type recombinase/integrase [Paracoccus zhejiangensis]AUH66042.1 hypothetical protein CX676_19295 [Paracoccus zhejiangensis]